MGYRSDGAVAFLFRSRAHMVAFFVQAKMSGVLDNDAKDGDDSVTGALQVWDREHDVVVSFTFEGWKWYEGYPFVDTTNKLLDLARENGVPNRFIRVGEEYNDIEDAHSGTMLMPDGSEEEWYDLEEVVYLVPASVGDNTPEVRPSLQSVLSGVKEDNDAVQTT